MFSIARADPGATPDFPPAAAQTPDRPQSPPPRRRAAGNCCRSRTPATGGWPPAGRTQFGCAVSCRRPEVGAQAQVQPKSTAGIRGQSQAVEHVESIGVFQPIDEADDVGIIAIHGGSDLYF